MENINRYQSGKIYKLVDNTNGNVYIGSTCEPTLAKRLANHVYNFNDYKKSNGKRRYISSYKILENDNYEIILIETYPCNSKDELFARERYWTNQLECVNIIKNQGLKIQMGVKEYKIQNSRKRYQEKKAEILEKQKTLCQCDCGSNYTINHKSRHCKTIKHKKYLEQNQI